jgi:hypothetical protein
MGLRAPVAEEDAVVAIMRVKVCAGGRWPCDSIGDEGCQGQWQRMKYRRRCGAGVNSTPNSAKQCIYSAPNQVLARPEYGPGHTRPPWSSATG